MNIIYFELLGQKWEGGGLGCGDWYQLLAEKGELPTRFGSATLGILLLQVKVLKMEGESRKIRV